MKKYIFFLSLLFCLNIRANWEYDPSRRTLLYEGQPFPVCGPIQTPIGFFDFLTFGTQLFYRYGWFPLPGTSALPEGEALSEEKLKKGWTISESKPSNLPEDWVFFPHSHLWAAPEAFLRLYAYWDRFYENIPILKPAIYNLVTPGSFYRVQTPYLERSIRKVQVQHPKNWIPVFEKTLVSYSIRKLFIFYVLTPKLPQNHYHVLRIHYHDQNDRINSQSLRIIYQNDTKISF